MDTQEHINPAKERFREAAGQAAFGQQQAGIATDRPTVETLGNLLSARDTCETVKPVRIALNGAAADVLRCLFFHGPTWDGNVPSKSGRDELVRMGLAARGNGWQWLTSAGMEACFANGIHDEKDRYEANKRKREARVRDAAMEILR